MPKKVYFSKLENIVAWSPKLHEQGLKNRVHTKNHNHFFKDFSRTFQEDHIQFS